VITIPYGDSMSASAQTAQTFQLTCSLTGALGDDKTARPGALAKVRVQMETAALLRAELESWTVRWRRIQTRQTTGDSNAALSGGGGNSLRLDFKRLFWNVIVHGKRGCIIVHSCSISCGYTSHQAIFGRGRCVYEYRHLQSFGSPVMERRLSSGNVRVRFE